LAALLLLRVGGQICHTDNPQNHSSRGYSTKIDNARKTPAQQNVSPQAGYHKLQQGTE